MFFGNINTRNLLSVPHACCHYMKCSGVGSEGGGGEMDSGVQVGSCISSWRVTLPDATLKAQV